MDETTFSPAGASNGSKATNALMIVAVVAVLVSAGALITTASKASQIKSVGYVSNVDATTDVEVLAAVHIEFVAPATLNWGSGSVNQTDSAAVLDSVTAPYFDGNWEWAAGDAPVDNGMDGTGLILNNTGSVDVDLELWMEDDAETWICEDYAPCTTGGSVDVNVTYQLSNYEAGSCSATGGLTEWTTWADPAEETGVGNGRLVCDDFNFDNANDAIEIHFQLTIPTATPPNPKSTTLHAEAVENV